MMALSQATGINSFFCHNISSAMNDRTIDIGAQLTVLVDGRTISLYGIADIVLKRLFIAYHSAIIFVLAQTA